MKSLILRDIKLLVKDYIAIESKSQNQTQGPQTYVLNCYT